MWIFTTTGFVSIVEDTTDKRMVLVRSRNRDHLVAFKKKMRVPRGRITHDATRDYPYRLRMLKERAAWAIFDMMTGIDYGNFKAEAEKRQGDVEEYVNVLHAVYWELAEPTPVQRVTPAPYRGLYQRP
jgi:hypothetical protein